MMPVAEMLEHLQRAQDEVKLVEDQLNGTAHPCATCGLTVREDFTQHQMKIQLEALRNKLKRFRGSLYAWGTRVTTATTE
jgi:predicted PP-loop superfamily ATPase